MTPGLLLETLGSLTLQVSAFLVLCGWLARRTNGIPQRDRQRACVHTMLLLMTGAGFLFPHWRWTVFSELIPAGTMATWDVALSRTAWIVASLWSAGCLCYFALILRELWRGYRLVKTSRVLPAEWESTIDRALTDARNPSAVPMMVRVSSRIASPLLWQFHRPAIVIPESMLNFPQAEVEAVLRHEAAHFQARHPTQLFVQRLGESLFWFHPLVWRASRLTTETRELRCDVEAVRSPAEARHYLNSLIRLLESRSPAASRLPATLSFLGSSQLLEKRLAAILGRFDAPARTCHRPDSRRTRTTLAVPTLALACALLLWLPLNPAASRRSPWSPWPTWSAGALDPLGVQVRDYEIDGHRLRVHRHPGRSGSDERAGP